MNEYELLDHYLGLLTQMNLNLVFERFEELRTVTFYWISKVCMKVFNSTE